MQLTGPLFLFLLLPLSLLLLRFTPAHYRRNVLSAFSLLWYVLVNLSNPVGLIHVLLLMTVALLYVYLPTPRSAAMGKLRTVVGVLIPLVSFAGARILAEYGNTGYVYPIGLAYISLAMISLAVDLARGDTIRPQNPLNVVGYLLFFPTLVSGPIIRSKYFFDNTEELHLSTEMMSTGIRRYMHGFIKRIALAAVLMRALRQLTEGIEYVISPLLLLLLLVLSYLAFYFFFTGTAEMARGVCAMYGIQVPRDRGHILAATSPDRVLCGMALSLYRFMQDYVYRPLCRLMPSKNGHILARVAIFVASVLFFRTRPEMLLFALPMLILMALVGHSKRPRLWVRLLLIPVVILCCSVFTLAITMDDPTKIFSLFARAFTDSTDFHLYELFELVRDFRYLLLTGVIAVALVPISYLRSWVLRKVSPRFGFAIRYVSLTLIFIGFVLTLIYFLPQFPGYSDQAYGFYQYTR